MGISMAEKLGIQVILEGENQNVLSNRVIISDEIEQPALTMSKLDWAYRVVARQIYGNQSPFIVIPIDKEFVSNYAEMYEGIYLIPLLWWHIVEPVPEAFLANDNFVELCCDAEFDKVSLSDMSEIIEYLGDPHQLNQWHMEAGLLIFGVIL